MCASHRPSNRRPVCQPPCSGQNRSRTRSSIGGAPSMGNGPRANTDGGGSFIMRLLPCVARPTHKVTVFLPARKPLKRERSTYLLMETAGRERLSVAPKGDPSHHLNTAETMPRSRGPSGRGWVSLFDHHDQHVAAREALH